MKTFQTLALSLYLYASAFASFANAGVVVTPITPDQIVPTVDGDCFYGVSTPQGCGPLRSS
ncbi:hypothetical protein F5Y17DRAFT_320654 [Xylariaceae sp. FL0594]|nr:hypothetical protein F5Y17DRAFT_320654 [Xylariaceae sp. FL0594]